MLPFCLRTKPIVRVLECGRERHTLYFTLKESERNTTIFNRMLRQTNARKLMLKYAIYPHKKRMFTNIGQFIHAIYVKSAKDIRGALRVRECIDVNRFGRSVEICVGDSEAATRTKFIMWFDVDRPPHPLTRIYGHLGTCLDDTSLFHRVTKLIYYASWYMPQTDKVASLPSVEILYTSHRLVNIIKAAPRILRLGDDNTKQLQITTTRLREVTHKLAWECDGHPLYSDKLTRYHSCVSLKTASRVKNPWFTCARSHDNQKGFRHCRGHSHHLTEYYDEHYH
jgi:hypothetical protein